ncbi:STAS/SEC14 domain-containing protein [Flexithrix dorotheae]|uniref:STAS/SEC14 domain-containing protein n=1 Tax=Flexithrix dorotheae TaxID=70993 RepID=UPI00037F83AA|nr:STAS/SEC14 domain-containing protein [Flexithrix dorotheae]
MKILIEKERASLHHLPEINSVLLTWKTYANHETYKYMFTKGVDKFLEVKATSWISDIRNEGVISPELSKWLKSEAIPKAIAGGLKRIAVVMDSDVFKKFYVKNVKQDATEGGIKFMEYFDNLEDAKKWIEEMQEVAV